MSRAQSKAQFKGLNFHIHVTVTKHQRTLLVRLAKRKGIPISRALRTVIDEWEAAQ